MVSSRTGGSPLGRVTGALFVTSAVTFAGAAAVLSSTFDWPDILRQPAGVVLPAFAAGGTGLVWTWFATAWTYGLLAVPMLLLPAALGRRHDVALRVATSAGALSVVLSLIGFLRWVFVVPALARSYVGGDASTRAAVDAAWTVQHQFGGALLGEHLGQLLAIAWSVTLSVIIVRSRVLPRWLGVAGLAVGALYLLNQGDVLATAVPGFPVWDLAGLIGSTGWGLWVATLGVILFRHLALEPTSSVPDAPDPLDVPTPRTPAPIRPAPAGRPQELTTMTRTMTEPRRSNSSFLPSWAIWTAGFLAFPLAGLAGHAVAGRVESPLSALTGGAVAGLVIGAGQALLSRRRLDPRRWIPASAAGMGIGLLLGAAAVGYRTSLADLAIMGAITGVLLGAAQAVALPARTEHRLIWAAALPILWALGWTTTTLGGIHVDEQFVVFGAYGALAFSALSGVLLGYLLPYRVAADPPPAHTPTEATV